jgi:pilus assembly protein CpaF
MKTFGRRSSDFLPGEKGAESPHSPPPPHGPTDVVISELRRRPVPTSLEAILSQLRARVLEMVEPSAAAELPAEELRRQLEVLVHELASRDKIEISAREQQQLAEELAHDMVGYGPLQQLLADDRVTDIMVNGPDNVYVERGGKLERTAVKFRDPSHIANISQKIAAGVGRRIDESSPMVDARLPDGSRVNIVFPPLALDSPVISIRKFARRRPDFRVMATNGTMTPPLARLLEIAARCRLNILISGGTGSGKTTLLNAMSKMIDHGERIVTIEDAAELQLQQPHVVRLETRPPNLEGKGEITQRDLVRNALRMRPDRIIVGEVRGTEAFDMLQAMNTGHDGSITTIHANTGRDALVRVENMVQMGSFNLPLRAIRMQIASAIDVVVQIERMRDGVRRVVELVEIVGMEGDVITMNTIAAFEFVREDQRGFIEGVYRSPKVRPRFQSRLAYFGLDRAWAEALQEL